MPQKRRSNPSLISEASSSDIARLNQRPVPGADRYSNARRVSLKIVFTYTSGNQPSYTEGN
jgi:hypothetical protein